MNHVMPMSPSEKVLVTYATRSGSTAGVAEAIGQTLAARGLKVDVRATAEVDDVTPYSAVIVGSAIQSHAWLPEAVEFVRRHQAVLSERTFAMFSLCMTMAMPGAERYREGVEAWVAPVRQIVKPVSEGVFAGILDVSKVPSLADRLKFRLSIRFGVWKEGDHRDWRAIRDWANELAERLQPTPV